MICVSRSISCRSFSMRDFFTFASSGGRGYHGRHDTSSMRKKLAQFRAALRQAYADPANWLFAALGALFVLFLAVALSGLNLLGFLFRDPVLTLGVKLSSAASV